MDDYTLRFGQTVITMPWWWLYALAGWLAIMGLILFFLGQRLVKPTFAILGLVLGATMTLALLKSQWPASPAMPWVIAAGLVFGVLFLVLWRIWMAGVFGDFVAIVAPVLLLIVSGINPPPVHEPIGNTLAAVGEAIGIDIEAPADPSSSETEQEEEETEAEPDDEGDAESAADPVELTGIVLDGAEQTRVVVADWWDGLEPSTRWGIAATSIGGGIVGFVLALALPMFGASVVTSFLGTLLMLPGVVMVTGLFSSGLATSMTSSPTGLVIGIAIATIIGALIQWMILKPSADK